jgi:hypothetical protein
MATLMLELPVTEFDADMRRLLSTMERQADRVVAETAVNVLGDIVEGWPVDSGLSLAAWAGPTRVAPLHYQLSNNVQYALVIEMGGYKGVGPRTEHFGGNALPGGFAINPGIYPTQRPQAPVRRALSAHHNDITEGLRQLLRQSWGR